ncbi:hypothetical protein POSPLADRAFT_1052535 [Postia placenta MAD-698-R-SB12]|uniref:Uncharacterized protein n=1 Tax=Postia placenta MAD-698-R-SB12 TaxID=670580 RepID=A0A1X6NB60_9APHY|nr:hypothetical protein POSPLADRAFT_1052535 [Postia placenta MAD-698-R-SB12]OSX65875.1 hypothetical protein POSPLADRAFT_1052535 [Postia placenta MAD-698-R-SB12]
MGSGEERGAGSGEREQIPNGHTHTSPLASRAEPLRTLSRRRRVLAHTPRVSGGGAVPPLPRLDERDAPTTSRPSLGGTLRAIGGSFALNMCPGGMEYQPVEVQIEEQAGCPASAHGSDDHAAAFPAHVPTRAWGSYQNHTQGRQAGKARPKVEKSRKPPATSHQPRYTPRQQRSILEY